jgi:hypothetical protein
LLVPSLSTEARFAAADCNGAKALLVIVIAENVSNQSKKCNSLFLNCYLVLALPHCPSYRDTSLCAAKSRGSEGIESATQVSGGIGIVAVVFAAVKKILVSYSIRDPS